MREIQTTLQTLRYQGSRRVTNAHRMKFYILAPAEFIAILLRHDTKTTVETLCGHKCIGLYQNKNIYVNGVG